MEFKLLPDLLSGDSAFVELKVQEDCILHHISIECNSSRRRGTFIFCSNSCLEDAFADDCPVRASLDEAMVQEAHEVSKVLLVGVLFEVYLYYTIYCTFDATLRVLGRRGIYKCRFISFL